jgi:hypothetical protein
MTRHRVACFVAWTTEGGMDAMTLGVVRSNARWFYVAMAASGVVIAFGGFVPTYWAKLAQGSFTGAPILHIHGALFFAWTLFFLVQTTLVATGRTIDHRHWGMAGISLATAMGISVVLASINSMKVAETIAMGDAARRFSVVALSALVVFAALFGLAIANVRRAEAHKRYMLLAMVPLLQAATARVFMTLFAPPDAVGPPPVFVAVPPGVFVDLFIVAAIVFDWRTRGRPHPIYLIGGSVIVAVQLLCVPISDTAAWMAVATWVESLAG